jgi:hypothetical protein
MGKLTLEEVNNRLKSGKVGVAVCQRGDRLSLRATFPAYIHDEETKSPPE